MPAEVVVVQCGMMTPIGLSAAETAASARARTGRLQAIDWLDGRFKPFTVGEVPEDGLPELHPDLHKPPLTSREVRMLQLATVPLQDALAGLSPTVGPVPLLLGLPDVQNALPILPADFLARLVKQSGANIATATSMPLPNGRASALLLLKEACERLGQKKSDFVLVGAVDSYLDLHVLGTLDMHKRVRHDMNPDGFAPGEGAAFVLLTTPAAARKNGLPILAHVAGCASGQEKGHLYSEEPYRGDGLAETFTALFEAAGSVPPVGCVYASFNGERYWAKEFGVAMLRNRDRFVVDHQMEHPAECFGDLGAAHGAVLLGLAALGIKEGYRRAPALVYASSDFGERAAVLLTNG